MEEYEKAVEWLEQKSPQMKASFYENPLGEGWCCALEIYSPRIRREAVAETKQLAAQAVSILVAKELGWKGTTP